MQSIFVGCQVHSRITWNKQYLHWHQSVRFSGPLYPGHAQNPKWQFIAVFVYWHPAWMQRTFCLACCYFWKNAMIHKHKWNLALITNTNFQGAINTGFTDILLLILFTLNSWATDKKIMNWATLTLKIPKPKKGINGYSYRNKNKKLLSWTSHTDHWATKAWSFSSLCLSGSSDSLNLYCPSSCLSFFFPPIT